MPFTPMPRLSRRSLVQAGGASVALLLLPSGAAAAKPKGADPDLDARVLHDWVRALQVAQRDARALPPAAARLYALGLLAAHEASVDAGSGHRSLGGLLNGLPVTPVRRRGAVIAPIQVNAAVRTVAIAASWDRSQAVRDALAAHATATHNRLASGRPPGLVRKSVEQGEAIGAWLTQWAATDGYSETRTLAYTPPVGPGLWRLTPPNFGTAIEPHWPRIRPFSLQVTQGPDGPVDPAAPVPPIAYDDRPGSAFHDQAMAVVTAARNLTDEQRAIALHWRDNPDGVTGLPSGHWLRIASDAVADLGLPLGDASRVLAITAICVADAFTSCWIEKYRSNVLRPVTYIRDHIDPEWSSSVNSPAFPEYTSGHSTGSGAAALALATLIGDRAFTDRTVAGLVIDGRHTLGTRTFTSFTQAADEAAVSRLYGGIHYPMGIDEGLVQGREVARLVLSRVS